MRPGFELDHIGIATASIEQSLEFYRALGWKSCEVEDVPTEKVRVAFIEFENNCTIELLEPTAQDSVVAKFLAKRGGGIHHICYRVKGIESVMARLKAEGVRVLDEVPRAGAHGCKVAFIHPSAAGGVLVELSEKK